MSSDEKYMTAKQHEHFHGEYTKIGALLHRLWKGWRKLG